MDISTFEVAKASEQDLMESTKHVALQKIVCYLESLEDEDLIMASHALVV